MHAFPRSLVVVGFTGLGLAGLATSPLIVSRVFSGARVSTTTPILEVDADTITTYRYASATMVQSIQPQVGQRGVNVEGTFRAPPSFPMHVSGNPFENTWSPLAQVSGVRLDTGHFGVHDVDIALPAEGISWVIGRSFNARQVDSGASYRDSNGLQGKNWMQDSQPEIVLYDDSDNTKDIVYLVYGADRFAEYKRVSSSSSCFKGTNGAAGIFLYASGAGAEPDTYTLTDQSGNEFTFFGFDSDSGVAKGQIWKIEDPDGNKAYVGHATTGSTAISSGFNGSGYITTAYDPSGRRFVYTYTTLDSVLRLTKVEAQKDVSGTWTNVAKVEYSYYTSESYGDVGGLKMVTVTTYLTDSGVTVASKKYFRYWEGTFNDSTNPGHPYALKYILDYEGTRQQDWADSTFDEDFASASDDAIDDFASAYFEYDSSHRIDKAWFNGECGCGTATNGTHEFEYESNGSFSDTSGYTQGWKTRTVVKRPDTTYWTQYFDEANQPLHRAYTDIDPDTTSPTPKRWVTEVGRNTNGVVVNIYMPSNINVYTHSTGSITNQDAVGLVYELVRTTTSSSTRGFLVDRKFKLGNIGVNEYYEHEWVYTQVDLQIGGDEYVIRPVLDKEHAYQVEGTSTSNRITTEYTHAAYSGELALESFQTADPAITTGKNGSGTANSTTTYFRKDGTVSFVNARDGIITYTEYVNGRMTERIEDVDTSITADFDVSVPGGLSSSGTEFHRKTAFAYDDQGRPDKTTYADGREMKSYYSKLADTRLVSLSYNDYDASPLKFYGPVQYAVRNQAGKTEVQATVALTSNESTTALTGHVDETDADPITAMDLGTVAQLRTSLYNETGAMLETSRLYFLVPGSGSGTDGTNYDATTYTYDDMGRRTKVTAPHGTIDKTTFDAMGRVSARWIGTDDGSPGNMVKTEGLAYDSGSDMGDSLLTSRTLFVVDGTTNQRIASYSHDLRGRVLLETNPETPHAFHKVDNEGRVLATGLFSSTGSIAVSSDDPTTETSNRWALTEWAFDETGQLWRTKTHKIDSADGSDDDNLEDLSWRDADGREIKHDGSQLAKTYYDRLGRRTHAFVLAEDNDTVYADADDVSGDYVLEESQSVYDTNTNEVLMSVQVSRNHDDYGGGATTGALDTNADSDNLLVTATNLEGRAQITATWYDRFWRTTDSVAYGTYGGSNFDRDGLSVPSRSDTALRTTYSYDTDGTLQDTTDPRALVMRREYDDAGRATKEIRNYNSGVNSGNPANPDDNQTVTYGFTDGLRTTITADLPSGETDQTTTYTYGTTKGSSGPDSLIATGHLLQKVAYPDKDPDVADDVVKYAYNAQGELIWQQDQKHSGGTCNVTQYDLDDEGKREHRRVTTLGTGLNNSILRVSTVYDSVGRPSTVTQYDNATVGSGTVKDQTQYTYDGWSNVTKFEIDPDTVVGGGTIPDKEVSYSYSKATTGRNTVRRSDMTLPSGNVITFDYSLNKDGSASRVSKLVDGAVVLAKYDYLGAGHVVGQNYEEISVFSRDYDGSGYSLLDRFDRPTKNAWTSDLSTDRNFYDIDVTWDRNSNITRVEDNVHSGFDVAYTIDDLDRLTDAEEGTWNGSGIADRKRHQTWTTLTHTGNWSRAKLDLDGDDNWNETNEYDDTRTHNAVNELQTRDLDSTPGTTGNNYTLTYDAVGELTDDDKEYKYQYDAFGRLRKVQNQAETLVAEYRYNGLGFMIGVHEDSDTDGDADASDKWYYPAYDEAWRMVANYRESDSSPKEEWVNHLAGYDGIGGSSYINGVVLRDKDANTDWTSASDGTLEQRVYLCQNWRGDVSALVKTGKLLLEWAKYSAHGIPFGLPGADTDSDGDCDGSGAGTDIAAIQTLIDGSAYGVRADVDLDGDVDSTDKTSAQANLLGQALGWSALSGFGNKSAFHAAQQLHDVLFAARSRVVDVALGVPVQRATVSLVFDPTETHRPGRSSLTAQTAGKNSCAEFEYQGDVHKDWICPWSKDCSTCDDIEDYKDRIANDNLYNCTSWCSRQQVLEPIVDKFGTFVSRKCERGTATVTFVTGCLNTSYQQTVTAFTEIVLPSGKHIYILTYYSFPVLRSLLSLDWHYYCQCKDGPPL